MFNELWQKFIDVCTHINMYDILDMALVTILFFCVMLFFKKYSVLGLVKYVVVFCILAAVVVNCVEYIPITAKIFSSITTSIVLLFFILFSTELRLGIFKASSRRTKSGTYSRSDRFSNEELSDCVDNIVRACMTMAKNNTGALIVMVRNSISSHILESGTKLNSILSASLLECIFNTAAPLHDGAVVVDGNNILAAGCFLPLSQNGAIPKELGTRHRAAIGVTEMADVVTIVISEEDSVISVAENGELERYYDSEMLSTKLRTFFGIESLNTKSNRKRR